MESLEQNREIRRAADYEIVKVTLDQINVCAQVRNGSNPIQAQLQKSYTNIDFINPMTATILDRAQTEEYIEFTNNTWGYDTSIDDFTPWSEDPDKYVLLIAGHTRLKACTAAARAQGYTPEQYEENLHIMPDTTSIDGILRVQVEENIHSTPSPQNAAKVLAESWLRIKMLVANGEGPRISKKEFAKKHSIGEQALRDALSYVELPLPIRQLTDEGILPFTIATEIGRSTKTIREYAETIDPENKEEIFTIELSILAYRYSKDKRVISTRQYIRAHVDSLREEIAVRKGTEISQQAFDLCLLDQETPLELATKRLEHTFSEGKKSLTAHSINLHNAISELSNMTNYSVDEELHRILLDEANAELGKLALAS